MLKQKKNTKQYPDVWMSHLVQLPGSANQTMTLLRKHIHPEFSKIRLEREEIQRLAADSEGG